MSSHPSHDQPEEHDLGLSHDLPTILTRRRALGLMSAAGLAAALAACGAGDDSTASSSAPRGGPGGGPGGAPPQQSSVEVEDGEVPEETNGPYPADGTNGVNVLTESGVVRSDITRSFGAGSAVATGVPMVMDLKIVNLSDGDASPYEGAAIYVWHCDDAGRYSMYDDEVAGENYLRGVQAADADGAVSFTSIWPAAYSGRWPHVHFEVYPSLAKATSASDRLRTSQIALPKDACDAVYATTGYERSVANMQQTSLDSDNVFSDGYSLQLAKATGSVDDGYRITLNIAV